MSLLKTPECDSWATKLILAFIFWLSLVSSRNKMDSLFKHTKYKLFTVWFVIVILMPSMVVLINCLVVSLFVFIFYFVALSCRLVVLRCVVLPLYSTLLIRTGESRERLF